MLEYESVVATQGIPLQAQIEELRRRAQTIARLQGGHTHYLEEVRIFREYIDEHRLPRGRSKASLNLPPDEEGNGHQVWILPAESRFVKVTWPGFFGLSVLYRQDEDLHASPIAYLNRRKLGIRAMSWTTSLLPRMIPCPLSPGAFALSHGFRCAGQNAIS